MLLFGSVKTKIKDVMNQLAMHRECKYMLFYRQGMEMCKNMCNCIEN